MSQHADTSLNIDLTRIENAEVRRTLRTLIQQMQQTIDRQQAQIDALLEMMLDKHVGSIGEYRHHLQRLLQHADSRAERMHQTVQPAPAPATAPKVSAATPRTPMNEPEPDENGHRVYRL